METGTRARRRPLGRIARERRLQLSQGEWKEGDECDERKEREGKKERMDKKQDTGREWRERGREGFRAQSNERRTQMNDRQLDKKPKSG